MLVGTPAHAASTFSYDFENLASGALVGQDGWSQVADWFSPEVASGGGINPTKASGQLNPARGTSTGALRSLGSVLTLAAGNNWLRRLPAFHCESFGCIGEGLLLFGIACCIPLVMGVLGFIVGKPRRVSFGFEALGIATLCILVSGAVINSHARSKVVAGCEDALRACQENPKLCTPVDVESYQRCAR